MTATAALRMKGLEHERVELTPGPHVEAMREIYGEGNHTVPGMLVDGEPVHGSRAILARLDELVPEPVLYPSEAVREADRWGDGELQDLGRRLPWGAMHFRPETMGTFGGAGALDGPGTDFAIGYIRASWKYHHISAARLQEDLAGLPELLAHVEQLAADGVTLLQSSGQAAWKTVFHFHIHVIPRYAGDPLRLPWVPAAGEPAQIAAAAAALAGE